jgi:ferric-dicitrate binding protein FerR (iron transport regulator)
MRVMAIRPSPAICERARAWASLRLDAELSEFEEAMLTAHLRRCSACCEYEESVRGAVLALRDEPLVRLEHPVSVPSRRRAVLRPAALARVAAVVAVAVGIATALTSQSANRLPATPGPSLGAAGNGDLAEIRLLRATQLGATPQRGALIGSHGALLQGPGRQ